ncbi:MAG: hypothetical protein ACLT98_06915 [Eggerthellaceae bacterium]
MYEGHEREPESMWASQFSNANMIKTDFFKPAAPPTPSRAPQTPGASRPLAHPLAEFGLARRLSGLPCTAPPRAAQKRRRMVLVASSSISRSSAASLRS